MIRVTNVVIAGLGGQGVIKASDILASAAFRAGLDVKKAEVHGMSQRGGSVNSDVRFGSQVLSPMVAPGEADFLVVLDPTQVEPHRHLLRPEGRLILSSEVEASVVANKKSQNVAVLGLLSRYLDLSEEVFVAAIEGSFAPEVAQANVAAFRAARAQ